jgi:hypothetical protein
MIIGKATGIDVITIACKGLWGRLIPPRFLFFLSSLIVIRRPPGLYSDRSFQVANRKSFLRLLLVYIVLICLIFSSFFRNKCFFPWHPVIPLQSGAPLESDAVYSHSSGDQTLIFLFLSLAARIWDSPAE